MLIDVFILLRQEIFLVLLVFFLLFCKLGKDRQLQWLPSAMNILLLLNLVTGVVFYDWQGILFSGMYHSNELIGIEKSILNLAVWIISMQSYNWLRAHKHTAEFYLLLLTTLLGMFLMMSAGHLLMFYVGLEMATIPLAAAVNFNLFSRRSSEAAMKLVISSAFSSALLLLGISFVYGIGGTLFLAEIPFVMHKTELGIFGFLLIFSGFAFKISAVPFHLWTADVYEGAPVSVTAYLSVVSKAAVLFVMITVLYRVFKPLESVWYPLLIIVSLATIIIGNLFALRQENIKRFLAFSSIAQAGFMLVGITGISQQASASVVFFVLVYVFSNLAAFGVVSLVSARANKESIADYRSLYTHNPLLCWVITLALFSLAGVPPAAGFFGKFFLLMSGASRGDYLFISIAAVNMVVSFYYYLRIVKTMFVDKQEQPVPRLALSFWPGLSLGICVAGILLTGMAGCIYNYLFSISIS